MVIIHYDFHFAAILSVLKSRYPNSPYLPDGETHVKIIESLKKEFKVIVKTYKV